MNNQAYPPTQLRTVVYARTREGGQSFPVVLDLKPYVPQVRENVIYVDISTQPIASPAPQQYPVNNQPQQPNPFNCCAQFWSVFLLLSSFSMSVSAFIFFIFIVVDSIHNDVFQTSLSWVMGVACILFYSIAIILRLVQAISGCNYVEVQEKLSISFSLFLPGLKYHIFRLNESFESPLRKLVVLDTTCNILQLLAGIASLIASGNAFKKRTIYDDLYYSHDSYFILFGIFILIESGFIWPVITLVHGKWISKTLKNQKTRKLIQQGGLFYRAADYGGHVQYRALD